MAITKRSIVDDALGQTGNNLSEDADQTAALADQTLEWRRGSAAYDRELPILLERHPWPFARATEAIDQANEDDNPSTRFGYAYEWPFTCLWLQRVEAPGGTPVDYEIIGRLICMDYDGEDDDAPIATFIQTPYTDEISNLFWEILRQKIEVGLLRAFEDYDEAKRRDDFIEAHLLPLVRTRTDQQTPARRGRTSTILERRRAGGGPRAL
jgi:hypothetical protein